MIQRIIEKADVKHPVDADKILKEIKNYDIVSFDIFDTLLKRNVKEPTDVFSYMEKKYQINGFREKRIEAEKAARKKKNGLEISLEPIIQVRPSIPPSNYHPPGGAHLGRANAPGGSSGPRTLRRSSTTR